MPKQEEERLLGTLVSAFRDADLRMSRYRGIPFVRDETAQSHLFRIMDFWNTEMWDETSINAISKEVILTLLQCAARLYEDKINAKVAVDLIESTHTRAILTLGIQDVLCRVANQQYMENIRSDKSVVINAENYKWRADLFSTIRRNKARQLNYQAIIFEHISSLCHSYGAVLQNTFDIPKIDERFMFHNYVALSKAFNRYEKSWLVTLFPDIFKWEGQDSGDGTNGDGLLASNFGATKEAKQNISSNVSKAISSPPPTTTPIIIGGVKMSCDKPVSLESVEPLHWSLPRAPGESSPLITDGGAPLSLGQASTKKRDGLRGVCLESETKAVDSDFESFIKNKVLEFEKWMDLLRKRAIKYPTSTSARTVTSSLHEPNEFHDQLISQKEEKRAVGIKIERKYASNYHKEWENSLLSPSSNIPGGDRDLQGSGDDSDSIFRFSPDAHSDSANGKLPATLVEDADSEHRVRISSAKDAQQAFRSASSACRQSANENNQRRSNVLEPGQWIRGHQNKTRLATIPEEQQGQREVDDRHNEPEIVLKMVGKPLPELLHASHNQEAIEDDPCFGVRCN